MEAWVPQQVGFERHSYQHIEHFPLQGLFIECVRDIVGLYLNPPDHAPPLCVAEKNQCQAINPLGCPPWSAEHESNHTRTHDSYTTPRDAIVDGALCARTAGGRGEMACYD